MSDRLQFTFDLDAGDPGLFSARLDARLQDGSIVSVATPYPPGHPGNPLDTPGLLAKWHGLAQDALTPQQAEALARQCLEGSRATPVTALLAPLAQRHPELERTP